MLSNGTPNGLFTISVATAQVLIENDNTKIDSMTTTDLNSSLIPEQLVQSIIGAGVSFSNVTFTGDLSAGGLFTGGNAEGLGVEAGVILSSGNIANATGPNDEDDTTTSFGTPGDADLDNLIPNAATQDAAVLEFDFIPQQGEISFQYVFASEEYNEFVDQFNDAFAFFLNGENIAFLPGTDTPISINTVNNTANSTFFNDNDFGDFGSPTPFNTEFDGFTTVLTARATVTPNEINRIKLVVADNLDGALDSAVFLAAGSFVSTVNAVNDTATTLINQAVEIPVLENDSDPDGDPLQIESFDSTSAQGGTISLDDNNTPSNFTDDLLLYIPATDFIGSDSFTYSVSDGGANAIATVNVSVNQLTDIDYSITTDTPVLVEGDSGSQPITFTITRTGAIQDDSTIEYTVSGTATTPEDFTVNGAAPLTGTINFASGETEKTISIDVLGNTDFEPNETIDIVLSNGTAPNGLSTISVPTAQALIENDDNSNTPPETMNDTATTNQNTPVSIDVLANDADPDGTSVSIDTFDSFTLNGGTIALDDNGTPDDSSDDQLIYFPAQDFTGTDNFEYTITDGSATATATVTVTVEPSSNSDTFVTLFTPTGDGSLNVTLDAYGSFGSAVTSDALYDPVGDIPEAGTTFESAVAFRIGESGSRTFLSVVDIRDSGNLPNPDFTTTSQTSAESTFSLQGLDFDLTQSVSETFQDSNRTGSILTQTYNITNPGTEAVTIELIRYLDGDLLFDGSLTDGGGRLFRGEQELLFETDTSGEPDTSTTFVGITSDGGVTNLPGRLEIDSFSGLANRIIAGTALDDVITGDGDDTDEFVDAGEGYDITLALRNVFTLDPGQSTLYTTDTIFGSGAPEDAPIGNTAPIAVDDISATDEDTSVVISSSDLLSNDSDAEDDPLTLTGVDNATNGSVTLNSDGDVVFTPNDNFNGSASFEYTISDGTDTSTATVNVTVNPVNDAPVADDDSASTSEESPVQIEVLDGDSDIDGTINPESISITSGPGNGNVTVNADGTVNYVPEENFNGQDSFTYTVQDNEGAISNEATVTIDVAPVSDDITYAISTSPTSLNEGDSGTQTATFTITRSGALQNASSIEYSIASSATFDLDFTNIVKEESGSMTSSNAGLTGVIDFAAGESQKTLTLDILGDTEIELNETISVVLSNGTAPGGTPNISTDTAEVTIVNDDVPVGGTDLNIGLYDADTDTLITIIEPGAEILASTVAHRSITIAAFVPEDSTFFGQVESMQLNLNENEVTRVEELEPYALFGDINENYRGGDIPLGENTIDFRIFSGDRLQGDFLGTVSRNFTIVDDLTVAPPVVTNDFVTVSESETSGDEDINVLVNDQSGTGSPIEVKSVSNNGTPASSANVGVAVTGTNGGLFTINGDGSVDFDANGDFEYLGNGDSTTTTVDFGVGYPDSTASGVLSTLTVTVEGENDTPIAVDDVVSTLSSTTVIDVLANDSDPDTSDTLSISDVTLPTQGSVQIDNGFLIYTPDASFEGSDSFEYTIIDEDGATASAQVTLTDDPLGTTPDLSIGLYDADSDTLITVLEDNAEILASSLVGKSVTIAAFVPETSDLFGDVESVRLDLNDGQVTRTENVEPYALFGDVNSNFSGGILPSGANQIEFDLYSGNRLMGENLETVTRNFTVVDDLDA